MTDNTTRQDTKHVLCMSDSHPASQKPAAQFALRMDFALKKKGFRNKTETAYLELYACVSCATQRSADNFKAQKSTRELGQMIAAAAYSDNLNWKETRVFWAPRHEADLFFQKLNEKIRKDKEEKEEAERVDAAARQQELRTQKPDRTGEDDTGDTEE